MAIVQLALSSGADRLALEDWGPVGLPLSDPPCQLRGTKLALGEGAPDVGLWECTPGRYRRQVAQAEVMHVLAGEATFTPDAGAPVRLRAGDVFHFGVQTTGVWDIVSTVRKLYVIFPLA